MSERPSKQSSSGEQARSGGDARPGSAARSDGPAASGERELNEGSPRTSRPSTSRPSTRPSSSQPARPPRLPLGATPAPKGPLPESRAWNAVSTMLSGLLGFGVPGYLVDRWLGTNGLLTLLGLLLGMAAALTVIWFRYGTERS